MRMVFVLGVVLTLAAPVATHAASPSYDYLGLSYSKSGIDGLNGGKGYAYDGSYAITDNFFISGIYAHQSFDSGFPVGGEFTQGYTFGVGYRLSVTDSMDFVVRAGYANDYIKYGTSTDLVQGAAIGSTNSTTGYDAGLGLRAMVSGPLELNIFADHNNVGLIGHDHTRTETVVTGGLMYSFTGSFALGASYATSNRGGAKNWMLTGRWYFHP